MSVLVEVGTARLMGPESFVWACGCSLLTVGLPLEKVTDQASCDLMPLPWVGLFGTHAGALRRIGTFLVILYCL